MFALYRVSQSSGPKVNADISGAIRDIDSRSFVSCMVLMPILYDITIICVHSFQNFFRIFENFPDFSPSRQGGVLSDGKSWYDIWIGCGGENEVLC